MVVSVLPSEKVIVLKHPMKIAPVIITRIYRKDGIDRIDFDFRITKTNELIIPLAEKVSVFVGVIFALVFIGTPPADGALIFI
jgi:hypothetical protein